MNNVHNNLHFNYNFLLNGIVFFAFSFIPGVFCLFRIFMCVWRILLLAFTLLSHHINRKKIGLN